MKNSKGRFLLGFLCGCVAAVFISYFGFQAAYSGRSASVSSGSAVSTENTTAGTNSTASGSGSTASDNNTTSSDALSETDFQAKLKMLRAYIEKYYYFDDAALAKEQEGAYAGLVSSLDDSYSSYYTKEQFDNIKDDVTGAYSGIGAYISQNANTGVITIFKCFKDGPAEKAGILPGDIIYKIDGTEVTGDDLTELVQTKVKGEAGTKVTITVVREGKSDPIDITVTRAVVTVQTVNYEMLADSIGYIQVMEFDQVTSDQFAKALADLESQKMKGLVIDLRDNPGGIVDAATNIADQILKEGTIVTIRDKAGKEQTTVCTDSKSVSVPITLLVNGNSASAAEILSGALKDHQAATLVGTKTYGKGIVQTYFPLPDGSCIKLTTNEYLTPSGASIHKIGITPDVVVELDEKLKQKASITHDEDNQLQKALSVLKEKIKSQ